MFRRWRSLRAEDPHWGERGFIWVPLLIAVGAGLVFTWAVKVGTEYAQGEVSGPSAPPPIRVADLHAYKAPPSNDCGKRVLDDFKGTVSWNAEIGKWEAPDTTTPKLPYNPDKGEVLAYNKQVKDWNDLMDGRVGVVLGELNAHDCYKAAPPVEPPKTKGPEPEVPSIFGFYYLKATGGSLVQECSTVLPPSLQVSSGSGSTVFNLTVTGHGEIPSKTFQDLPLTSSLTFSGGDPAHYWSISGGFVQRSSGVVVTGTYLYNVGGGCGIDFEGTTTPP